MSQRNLAVNDAGKLTRDWTAYVGIMSESDVAQITWLRRKMKNHALAPPGP